MSQPKRGIGAFRPDEGHAASLARGQNYLLAIGIDKYLHFPQLNNAVRDAESFVSLLQQRYQFDVRNTEVLFNENATERNLLFKLRDMARLITPEDNLVIYFSGHGAFDDVLNEGYWIPVDAERDAIEDYIPNSKIHTVLNAIHSRHTFLVIDSCFSGSLFMQFRSGASGEDRLEALPSRWGLTSGRNEVVPDGPTGQHSPFAESLLNQLTLNQGDLGVGELCQRVVESVAARSQQIPRGEPLRVDGHEGGQFFFRPKKEGSAGDKQVQPASAGTSQGGLLYSIPRSMEVGQESRCEVRVAFDKTILYKDFDPSKEAKVRDIRISNLMQVDLIDPLLGGTGAFTVRTISSAEQFVDPSDYTQWVFYVKALLEGVHPLVLKVTVIEMMEGRERRKEMVLEENIEVSSHLPVVEPENTGYVSGYTFTVGPENSSAEPPQPAPFAPPPPAPAPAAPAAQTSTESMPFEQFRKVVEPQSPPPRRSRKSAFGWMRTVAGLLVLLIGVVVVFFWTMGGGGSKEVTSPSPGFEEVRSPLAEARKILESDQPDLLRAEELIGQARRSSEQKELLPEPVLREIAALDSLLKVKKNARPGPTPDSGMDFKAEKKTIQDKTTPPKEELADRIKSPGSKSVEEGAGKPVESFTDQRDGKKYPAVLQGNQYWLQSNLVYQTDGMTCFENRPLLCENLGGLYTWKAALQACPKGWRLPDQKQWDALLSKWGGYEDPKAFHALQYGGSSFFQAQLAGMQSPKGAFSGLYEEGYFWTATPSGDQAAMAVVFDKKANSVKAVPIDRRAKLSCRCVKE